MAEKILILNNVKTKRYLSKQKYENKNIEYIALEDIEKYINKSVVHKIFGCGDELFKKIRQLHTDKKIHLGLRTNIINQHLLESLPVVQFNNVEVYAASSPDNYDVAFNSFLGLNTVKIDYPKIDIIDIRNYKKEQLDIFLNSKSNNITFDYETYGFPTDKKFFPLGVGLYDPESNYACYFSFPDEYENIKNHPFFIDFRELLSKRKGELWAYNCPFEMNVSYRMYGELYEIQDVFPFVIMDGRRGSLKLNGQYYIKIKSWDDEIDKLQKYFNEKFKLYEDGKNFLSRFKESKFFTNEYIKDDKIEKLSKGNVKNKIKKQDLELLGKNIPDILMNLSNYDKNWEDRIVKYWGNEWAVIPEKIMGYYCCIDCFVTYKILQELKLKYSTTCYKVHLFNMYLKSCSDLTGQLNVNWNLLPKVDDYYNRIAFNTNLFLHLMIFRFHKYYFDKTIGEDRIRNYNIPYGMLYVIYRYGSFFFLKRGQKNPYVNEFLSFVIKGGQIDYKELKILFGDDADILFSFIEPYADGKRKISDSIREQIYEIIEDLWGVEKLIKTIIDDYYILNEKMILERNEKIKNEIWEGSEEDMIALIKEGKFSNQRYKESILNWVKLYYIDDPNVKYRLNNNFLPTDYVKHILMFLTLPKLYKDLKNTLTSRTIATPINTELNKFLMYKLTSTKNAIAYGSWIEYIYKKDVFNALCFYDCYLENCAEGFEPGLSIWQDFVDTSEQFNKPEMLEFKKLSRQWGVFYGDFQPTWRLTNFYKNLTNKKLLNFCKCFSDKTPSYITKDSFLEEPEFELNDLFYIDFFDKIYRLYKFSVKELTAAIKRLKNNSYKLYKQENVEIGYFTDKKDETAGNRYYIPKIIPLKTKTGRFSADIHTIGGGDDGKLLTINDDPSYIASYFDVSQAEVRMLATMCQDPELLKLYKEGGDAYKKMALMAYPYLSGEGYESKLKAERNNFKSVFLSFIYRALPYTIAINTGLPVIVVNGIVEEIIKTFHVAESWANEVTYYAKKYKRRKTFFGEYSPIEFGENISTTAVNHIVQGATTKILGTGYYNIQRIARLNNIFLLFKYTVHDSNINVFKTKDLFKLTMLYRKFFRAFIRDNFGVDFKYDLDLLPMNHRDHMSFNYNHKSGEFKLKGFGHQVDKILNGLEKDFNIIESKEKDYVSPDNIKIFTSTTPGRDHNLFPVSDYFTNIKEKTVIARLSKIEKYDFIGNDFNEFNDEIN